MRFLSPIVQVAALAATVIATMWAIGFIETHLGLRTVTGYTGDVDLVLATLFFGTIFFGAASLLTAALEAGAPPARTHFRQCSLCYFLLAAALFTVIGGWREYRDTLMFAVTALIAGAAFWGILLNAILIFRAALRAPAREG